jgi:glycosyltransferase involved in cell wall biosynthesis
MRCLIVHNRYRSTEPSGENVVVDAEAAQLAARGHEVEVWGADSDDIAGFGLARTALLPATATWSSASARRLATMVDRFAPDVVHVHNVFPLITPSILPMLRDAGVPTTATIHNYRLICAGGSLYRDGAPCHDCVGRVQWRGPVHGCYRSSAAATAPIAVGNTLGLRQWRQVDVLLALSPAQRDLLVAGGLPADRIRVKPNFVDDPTDAPGFVAPPTTRDGFVFVGRLTDTKGIPTLLDAWRSLRSIGVPPRLTVIGDGPLADVVASEADGATISFSGRRTRQEVAAAMAQAVAVVVPSSWEETFGLNVVEAMAVGTPVIATDHGSFTDLVTAGHDGLLVPPDDADALAAAVRHLDRHRELAARLGRAARATYERRFTPERVMEQLEDAYREAQERHLDHVPPRDRRPSAPSLEVVR